MKLTRYTLVCAGNYQGVYCADSHIEPHANGEFVRYDGLTTPGGLVERIRRELDLINSEAHAGAMLGGDKAYQCCLEIMGKAAKLLTDLEAP